MLFSLTHRMYCILFYIRAEIHLEWAMVLDLPFPLSSKLFSYSFLPRSRVKSTSGLQLWNNRYKIVLSCSSVFVSWSHFTEPSGKPSRARRGFLSSAGMYSRNSGTSERVYVILCFIFHICVLFLANMPRTDYFTSHICVYFKVIWTSCLKNLARECFQN